MHRLSAPAQLPGAFGTALVATAAVAACGSSAPQLGTGGIERSIAESIRVQHNLHAAVTCPARVPRREGVDFTCDAHLAVGVYPVRATESDGKGRVVYQSTSPLIALDVAKIESAIKRSIFRRTHAAAAVSCPAEVLQQRGLAFTCRARVAGRTRVFAVTQETGGRVRYTEQP
jgi:hypothetical protein